MRRTGLLADSFFEGAKEFVEFEELFVHVDGGVLELLDFLGAVVENEGQGGVRRRWWRVKLRIFELSLTKETPCRCCGGGRVRR